jgi:hypothetical protein
MPEFFYKPDLFIKKRLSPKTKSILINVFGMDIEE